MKCEICNGSGSVHVNGGYNRCECQRDIKTKQLYKQAGIPDRYFKRFTELKDQPVVTGKGNRLKYKGLLEELLKNNQKREALFDQEITIILKGQSGSGKSQFASTLALELLNYFNLYEPLLTTNHALFIDAREVGNFMFDNQAKAKVLAQARKANILVLDDMGSENANQYIFNTMDEIIRNFKGVKIITTNLENPKAYYDKQNSRLGSVMITGEQKDHGTKNVLYYTLEMPKNENRRQKRIDTLQFD